MPLFVYNLKFDNKLLHRAQIDPRNDRMETPAQPRDKQDNVVSGFNSQPTVMDRGPLITPLFSGSLHQDIFKSKVERPHAPDRDKRYHVPPHVIPFEGARIIKPMGGRKRWQLPNGHIAEWDRQHGELEMYDKNGKHIGVFSPEDGKQIKPKVEGRRITL